MVIIPYKGGKYVGEVRCKKKLKAKGRRTKLIPHGMGTYIYDGVTYIGGFRQGYEDGVGRIIWPDGSSFSGTFKGGLPQATVLQYVQKNHKLKASVEKLESALTDCREDLVLEQEKSMDIALCLDNCQRRVDMLYYQAMNAGVDVGSLNQAS